MNENKGLLGVIWQKYDYNNATSLYECLLNHYGLESITKNNLQKIWPKFKEELHEGIKLLIHHIINKNKIIILGDYDVDGICGSVIVSKFLAFYNANYHVIIPNRFTDGYGLSIDFVESLRDVDLLITIDNGSTAVKEIQLLRNKNIDVLIIDHHHISQELPPANFIMNPKLLDYPDIYDLCGTGVAFVFCLEVQKYWKKIDNNLPIYSNLIEHLSLVALATVCDVVSLTGFNRAVVSVGLQVIKKQYWCELLLPNDTYINTETLGFKIGPYINAAGRFGDSNTAFKFLHSIDKQEQKECLAQLVIYNERRKKFEDEIMNNIQSIIANSIDDVFIYYSDEWPEGLLGILAARIKDICNKPTILFTKSKNNTYKASGRSFEYFHLGRCIEAAKHLIITGGGHCMAGGLTVAANNKTLFYEFVQDYYKNNVDHNKIFNVNNFNAYLSIDAVVSGDAFNEIKKFEPFGPGFLKPIFYFPNVCIEFITYINNKHALFQIKNANTLKSTSSIIFNILRTKFTVLLEKKTTKCHVIGNINHYNNKDSISIIDILMI